MWKRKRIKCYTYEEIETPALKLHKDTHTWEQHCWALASYFLRWLREQGEGDMLYADADIFFYGDYQVVLDEIGDHSIGIITHRFAERRARKTGHYNVGIIYFADTIPGTACLEQWNGWVMAGENGEFFPEWGTCGDQKYLELFEVFYPDDVCVIDDTVGHAAPWNVHLQDFDGNYIYWQGKKQKFIFYHFSHFNLHEGHYRTNRHGEWQPEIVPWAKKLYDDYYKEYTKQK